MLRTLVFTKKKRRGVAARFVESSVEIQNGHLHNRKLGSVLPEERRGSLVGVFGKVLTCFAVECFSEHRRCENSVIA